MTKKEKQYVEELKQKLKAKERRLHDAYKQLAYYEKAAAAARAFRLLYKNLKWGPDGCLALSEDYEFLELAERVLDDRLKELESHSWRREGTSGASAEALVIMYNQSHKGKEDGRV
jgi:hypothetical protein